MKKNFLLPCLSICCAALLFFASSCIKSADVAANLNSGKYYMKFAANGVNKEYRTDGSVSNYRDSLTTGGKKIYSYSLACAQLNSNYTIAETFTLGIYSDKILAAGTTYKESVRVYSIQPGAVFIYDPHPGTYARLCVGLFDASGILYPTVTRDVLINITAITSTSISGTFSGTVYQENVTGAPTLSDKTTITNGEFSLGIK